MGWTDYLPPPLRWRAIRLMQHVRVRRLKRQNPVPTLSGITIPVIDRLTDNICASIYDGQYEQAELTSLQNRLEESDVVLEIGAGIGFLSSYCAKRLGSDRVFAYEANIKLEPIIRSMYSTNKVCPSVKFGVLGRESGQTKFYVTKDFWASSLTLPDEPYTEVTVPVYSINDEIRAINPTILLVDIEGGEYDLFKSIDFHTIKKISVELHTDILGQDKIDEIKSIMSDAGFKIDNEHSRVIPSHREILFLQRGLTGVAGQK